MKPKAFVIVVGLVVMVVGVFVGFQSVSVSLSDGSPASCGSAFSPADVVATDFGGAFGLQVDPKSSQQRCADSLSGKRTVALVLLGVGALVMLGGAVIRTSTPECVA
jgi:hypothetical protein